MNRLFLYLLMGFLPISIAWSGEQQSSPQSITINTADEGVVDALMHKRGNHAVVLAYGAIFNKESWQGLVKTLSDKGFTTLALDFRGYGRSKPGTNSDALYEDILASVRYLRQYGAVIVSVVGASMGGAAAAHAVVNAKAGEIDQLILLSPVSIAQPKRLKSDILFIASRNEPMVGSIKAMSGKAPASKKLVLLVGRAHAQHIFNTDQSEKLTSEVIHFLVEADTND